MTTETTATAMATNPDMQNVGDYDDCLRCATFDDECGYHQGQAAGMAAAFQLMREFVEDPELMVGALQRRNENLRRAAARDSGRA